MIGVEPQVDRAALRARVPRDHPAHRDHRGPRDGARGGTQPQPDPERRARRHRDRRDRVVAGAARDLPAELEAPAGSVRYGAPSTVWWWMRSITPGGRVTRRRGTRSPSRKPSRSDIDPLEGDQA